ncbi:hypothetical protein GXW83_13600 [Streptacidiphilus sp. PB12-B1b]|uniref:hypothetical protein n=1 Tax=Streptacidiphilus sp. PB12-B1b TaxID=2705012 RepID=UPI0015FB4E9F|nr:hypothetical protein [Streptacidiphilus sp. PB12-B1b]QMU76623.1 hypothetical protein GXW83_13600 [Streptacidiphilus sp. PB12-B1b]
MLQREGRGPRTVGRARNRLAGLAAVAVIAAGAVSACSASSSTTASVTSAGTAAAAAPAAATSATPTRVVVVEPWKGAEPASDITVTGSASGHCFAPSIASTRHDAYRCLTGNLIYDPCFSPQTTPPGDQVLCVDGPSATRFLRVKLTAPLPAGSTGTPQVAPFALVLADGQFCLRNSGAERATSSLPLSYACQRGFLFGFPDTSAAGWTIRYQNTGGGVLSTVGITTAYR